MSVESTSGNPDGIFATARVVKGGNREVIVSVDLVCLYPDGQTKYETRAYAKVIIPFGDPIPVFTLKGLPYTEGQAPAPAVGPLFKITSHTVCRDPQGNIKWEADTEPIALSASEPLPPALVGTNTVVLATPIPDGDPCGY